MSNIQAKNRNPKGLGYNSWTPISYLTPVGPGGGPFPASLGLNMKFTHLSYSLISAPAVGLTGVVNLVSGYTAADSVAPPALNTSYGWADFAGVFAAGETITLTIGTEIPYSYNQLLPFVYTVTTRDLTLEEVVADFTTFLNYNPLFNGSMVAPYAPSEFFGGAYIANSLGTEMVFQPLTYDAVTPLYTFTTNSLHGTVTAGGAAMVAGTGGPNPNTVPILDQTDGNPPMVPSAVAIPGDALFPVDIIIPTFNASQAFISGSIYATAYHDAIFAANSAVTLTFVFNGGTSPTASFVVTVYGTPVDNHPQQPAEGLTYLKMNQFIL